MRSLGRAASVSKGDEFLSGLQSGDNQPRRFEDRNLQAAETLCYDHLMPVEVVLDDFFG